MPAVPSAVPSAAVVVHVPLHSLTGPRDSSLRLVTHAARHAIRLQSDTPAQPPPSLLVLVSLHDDALDAMHGSRTASWKAFHKLVSDLYFTASHETYAAGVPLMSVDVGVWVSAVFVDAVNAAAFDRQHVVCLPGNTLQVQVLDLSPVPASVLVAADAPTADASVQPQASETATHARLVRAYPAVVHSMVATKRIICGVMDPEPERLRKKADYAFMEPVADRLATTKAFLHRICRGIVHHVVPIQDDYGPTRDDASIQAIVGSAETAKGCESGMPHRSWLLCTWTLTPAVPVNKVRKEGHLSPLHVFIIDVISPTTGAMSSSSNFELKISSSYLRRFISQQQQQQQQQKQQQQQQQQLSLQPN
ncbi:hypothetical protein BC831DRAFT_451562 [Entophlyctis helioformis]|nr:hypothetical protein BC831DRAFT_451562 [Entophlyctis helioformis]